MRKDTKNKTLSITFAFFDIASLFVLLKVYLLVALQVLVNLCSVMVRFLPIIMPMQGKFLMHCTAYTTSIIFSLLGLILLFIGAGYFLYRLEAIFLVDLQGMVFSGFSVEAYPKDSKL